MTIFTQAKEHSLECDCAYCMDVDPNKSVSRELERYVEELMSYAITNLAENQQKEITEICQKVLLLRRYFPEMELPSKHALLVQSLVSSKPTPQQPS